MARPDIQRLSDRREALYKKVPPCLKCGTTQVQLIRYSDANLNVDWKCRHCADKFTTTDR
jgi:ribosomal protein L37AE/L43A